MFPGRSGWALAIAASVLLDAATGAQMPARESNAHQRRTPGGEHPLLKQEKVQPDASRGELDSAPRCVLVLPDQKLATCAVAKVASTDFCNMFNILNGLPTSSRRESCSNRVGIADASMTKEQGWTFATVTRDPLERYLSAWGSKCLPSEAGHIEGGGTECGGEVLQDTSDEEAVIEAFERRAQLDSVTGLPLVNNHFRKQSDILSDCGWDKFSPDAADFVASLTGHSLRRTLLNALMAANVSNSHSVVDEFFPRASITGHRSITHDMFKRYYRKNETVQAVYGLYKDDYELLGLELPEKLQA